MTNQVSITIPLQLNALKHAIGMLTGFVHDLELAALPETGAPVQYGASTAGTSTWTELRGEETTAEQAFGEGKATSVAAAAEPVQATGLATASTVPAPVTNDTPLPGALSAEVAAVTTSTNTTSATATSAVPLDSEGLPWDARIHSSSKEKIKDGTWKIKRGTDKLLIDDVKAELRAVMNIPLAPAPTETQGLHPNPNPLSVSAVNAIVKASNPTPPPPTPPAAGGVTTFAELMAAITGAKMDSATVTAILPTIDPAITSLPLLAPRPDLIPLVAEALGLK